MTYQPPPPPPGGNPPPPPGNWGPPGGTPPPPPGNWGPLPGSSPAGFDPKTINPLDWGIVGAGFLAFVFSFIAYYSGVTVEYQGRTESVSSSFSAWNDIFGGGFINWFAMLLAIAGAALVAVQLFAPSVRIPLPVTNRLAGLSAFAAAAVFIILGIFVTPSGTSNLGALGGNYNVSADHGFGYYVSFIAIIAGVVLSLMRLQATGGQLPGGLQTRVPNIGGYGPQGGIPGGQAPGQNPPPPPGYGPPQ